jgi:type 1 glutamine amidotransferase
MLTRRGMLRTTGAAALAGGLSGFPVGWPARAAEGPKKRLLVYTRSQTFEHDAVRLGKGGSPSLCDRTWTELGAKHGFDVECTKDGRVFLPETIAKFDAFFFYTTGDLTNPQRAGWHKQNIDDSLPMPAEGKKALINAVAAGKGFLGSHSASDTFHSGSDKPADKFSHQDAAKIDPYIAMLGGEFIKHGAQQDGTMHVVDPTFPGLKGVSDFRIKEEWYALKNFQPDLHVILVQDTAGMTGEDYQRPNFPATWARMHGKGRVFYTSLGHRDDVWANPIFQNLLLGAASWAFGLADADITPNLQRAAPQAAQLPKYPAPKK